MQPEMILSLLQSIEFGARIAAEILFAIAIGRSNFQFWN